MKKTTVRGLPRLRQEEQDDRLLVKRSSWSESLLFTGPAQENKVPLFFRKKVLAEKAHITTLKNDTVFVPSKLS